MQCKPSFQQPSFIICCFGWFTHANCTNAVYFITTSSALVYVGLALDIIPQIAMVEWRPHKSGWLLNISKEELNKCHSNLLAQSPSELVLTWLILILNNARHPSPEHAVSRVRSEWVGLIGDLSMRPLMCLRMKGLKSESKREGGGLKGKGSLRKRNREKENSHSQLKQSSNFRIESTQAMFHSTITWFPVVYNTGNLKYRSTSSM